MLATALTSDQTDTAHGRSKDTHSLPIVKDDLTDEQWDAIAPIISDSSAPRRGRPRKTSFRAVLDGILYRHAHNCSWRTVPEQYGGFRTLHVYFRQWSRDGILDRIAARLRIAELKLYHDQYLRLVEEDQKLHRRATRNRNRGTRAGSTGPSI